VTVIVKDRVDDILAAVRDLGARDVKVGFPESTGSRGGDDLNNPTLAYIHEYGAPEAGIPERPFLVVGVESALPTITKVMKDGAKAALTGRNTAGQTLNRVGLVAQGAVQKKIVNGPFAPNAPGTVQRKGSDRPLIDTGALRQAVSYVIEDKD
jgi:hypothetical protein